MDVAEPAPQDAQVSDSGETFCLYLAKQLVAKRGFVPGAPQEAGEIAAQSDIVLTFTDGYTPIIIALIVMVTHCYYGFNASGGPVGVGEAVGRSMRLSLVSVQIVVLSAALALYGVNPNFALTV